MYSSASNNEMILSGHPDPQTGLYSYIHNIGTIVADAGFGPQLDIQLTFNSMATLHSGTPVNAYGLGSGWSFRLTSYNETNATLTLSSGLSYTVLFASSSGEWVLSHKLLDIKVERQGSSLFIYYKDGSTEVLTFNDSTGNAYLSSVMSPSGRSFEFDYEYSSFYATYRLTKVSDSTNDLLIIDYDEAGKSATVTRFPNHNEESSTTVNYNADGKLFSITLPDNTAISLGYQYVNIDGGELYLIGSVDYPSGASESMEYGSKLYLQDGAPIAYQPALSRHTKVVSSTQPAIVTTYAYGVSSANAAYNYWGYLSSSSDWISNADNLADYDGDYEYTGQETCGDKVTLYRYNKFHQLLQKTETQGNDEYQKITTSEFFSIGNMPLSEQESRYELPKSHTLSFILPDETTAQTFEQTFEFDDWGNLITQKDISGVISKYVYYSENGEGESCPAHPYNLRAFSKSREVIPVGGSSGDSGNKVCSFTYKSIARVDDSQSSFIVSDTKSSEDYTLSNSYYGTGSDNKILSELKSQTVTKAGQATVASYGFLFSGDIVTKSTTLTSFDDTTLEKSEDTSIFSSNLISATDIEGVKSIFTYDKFERITSQVEAEGTDYEVLKSYEYDYFPSIISSLPTTESNIGIRTIMTSQGISEYQYFDAEQRELSIYKQDEQNVQRKAVSYDYDNQGRQLAETIFDYSFSDNSGGVVSSYSNKTQYVYGHFGEIKTETYPDGVILTRDVNPNQLSVNEQLTGSDGNTLPASVTDFNLFQSPVSKKQLSASGQVYSNTQLMYDGFGRLTKVTTPSNDTASVVRYDAFDRPVSVMHFDGSEYNISYAESSISSLMTSIDVGEVNLGTREFDGLTRMTSQQVNGATTTYSYDDNVSKILPSVITNARGHTISSTVIPELKTVSKITTKDGTAGEFVYSASSESGTPIGLMSSASNTNGRYDYTYGNTGRLKICSQTVGSNPAKSWTSEEYTLSGAILKSKASDGREISTILDSLRRVVSSSDGTIQTGNTFDQFGRISQFETYLNSVLTQSTFISYDEYSRETNRDITTGTNTTAINYTYDKQNRLVSRTTNVDTGNISSLSEAFIYDNRSRLTNYTADPSDGYLSPKNEMGKVITGQDFAFDGINNITAVVTYFPNGDKDTASYDYESQRLISIRHTLTSGDNKYPASMVLAYDSDGNITSLSDGSSSYALSYTPLNTLEQYSNSSYQYDAFNRVVTCNDTAKYYLAGKLISEESSDEQCEFVRSGAVTPVAEINNGNTQILAVDRSNSVIGVSDDVNMTHTCYTPFGEGGSSTRTGFNGEIVDKESNGYLLGNGARLYLPAIAFFTSQDDLSPFSSGGINPYLYCKGDPVNLLDPSGHDSKEIGRIFGILGGLVGLVLAPFTAGSTAAIGLSMFASAVTLTSSSLKLASDSAEKNGKTDKSDNLLKWAFGFSIVGSVLSVSSIGANAKNMTSARSNLKKRRGLLADEFDIMEDLEDLEDIAYGYKTKASASRQPKGIPEEFLLNSNSNNSFAKVSKFREYTLNGVGSLRINNEPLGVEQLMRDNELRTMSNTLFKNGILQDSFLSSLNAGGDIAMTISYWPKSPDDGGASS
ncbi:RHS repeat-associated core domain-containing protein [Shewanella sp. YLB-07]|uniref:RHS repeat-associated core domain-containing protein n=1 Tax=Shewanella sp. YLB-07 TaxID=2601268 RepID=UPI00128BBE08|nr:RHS repeat-associated core domain-containing protein [Shewanella sp. YLB-07]MPY26897.1 hypothetical protein [Shewanella sp. YLB-07]